MSLKVQRGRCVFVKNIGIVNFLGQSMESRCASPYGLTQLFLKDALGRFTCEVDICQPHSNHYLDEFLSKENAIEHEIEKLNALMDGMPKHTTSDDVANVKKSLFDRILNQRKLLNIERNDFCRYEACHHLLNCQCEQCKKKVLREEINGKISSINAFSYSGKRRENFLFHQKCFYSAIILLGFDPFKRGERLQTSLPLLDSH